MISILKLEPAVHVLKFKRIIRYHEKIMSLKKWNVGNKKLQSAQGHKNRGGIYLTEY